ncbi:hypothetical protein M9H77_23029 [Catharanthus roseus]|uniref:Uncharacterized protein n=1 Tax=Catharanthus roseus TaxID=4058 RepID=A0ACC0AW59_CATRO|nr:hypothetical protein M9H77_23029 [Catharanthus roseus]
MGILNPALNCYTCRSCIYLTRMAASRFLVAFSSSIHSLSHSQSNTCFSPSPRSLPLLPYYPRGSIKFRLTKRVLARNALSPRAFMSSSIATESFQEGKISQAYGAEQIQVK